MFYTDTRKAFAQQTYELNVVFDQNKPVSSNTSFQKSACNGSGPGSQFHNRSASKGIHFCGDEAGQRTA